VKTSIVLLIVLAGRPYFANGATINYNPASRDVVDARLQKYVGKDSEREVTLKQMFADVGCDGQNLTEEPVKGSKLSNVICVLPGSSDKVIIVGAHFDHVSEGQGVVDNWSGASLLPSLYQALKGEPRQHTFIFIGFTDEEKGEVGSHFYVQHMTNEQVAATQAMVNLDTLGLTTTKIWMSHSDKQLIQMLAQVAKATDLPVSGMDVDQVGTSDSEQFAKRKIPRITVHSLTQETWDAHILHTKNDNISKINMDDYYQTYCLLAAYLAFLDGRQIPATTSPAKP
jgi:putative aminopeptidase FrvX